MQFSEKELVNLFLQDYEEPFPEYWEHYFEKTYLTEWKNREIEFVLPSGRRCDLVFKGRNNRAIWVYEFKVHADLYSVTQLLDYLIELKRVNSKRIFIPLGVIAAQFFNQDAIAFCKYFGFGVLQISPYAKNASNIHWLETPNFFVQHERLKRPVRKPHLRKQRPVHG